MTKEPKPKRKQKQVYLPEDIAVRITNYRDHNHIFSDNQAIINLILLGFQAIKENQEKI